MALMASPAPDKPSLEPKAQPVPSADTMALDSNINGAANDLDTLFDDGAAAPFAVDFSADAHPQDATATNGDNATLDANAANGDLSAPDAFAAPVTDTESGIAPVAPFLENASHDTQPNPNPNPDPPANLAPTALPPSVEPATSDLRDEPEPAKAASEMGSVFSHAQSDNAPETAQESMPEMAPEMAPETAPQDASQDALAHLAEPNTSEGKVDDKTDPFANTEGQDLVAEASAAADVSKSDEPTEAVPPVPAADTSLEPPATAGPDATDTAAATAPVAGDQEMRDAPSQNKVRAREEDEDEIPLAKRAKTGSAEPGSGSIAKPEAPTSAMTNGVTSEAAPGPLSDTSTQAFAPPPNAPPKRKYDSEQLTQAQSKFLLERLRGAKKTKSAAPFLAPVDPVMLNIPLYPQVIKRPMDLSTMETKLKRQEYRSVDHFMDDFYLMIDNCIVFNGPAHPIAPAAWNLQVWFERGMHTMPRRDVSSEPVKKTKKPSVSTANKQRRESRVNMPPAHSPTNASGSTFALQADGTPLIRRDSYAGDGRPKREIHRPPPKDLPYSNPRPKNKRSQLELKFASGVVAEMNKSKHTHFSYPFMHPVDPVALNIPTYHKIIKKPMDLGTISGRLRDGQYSSAKEVKADIELMFTNCYKFNPEQDDVHKMGKMLEEVFRKAWAGKQAWMDEHAPPSEPGSPMSSDGEEDEASNDDDEEEAIREREAQIAQQIMQLTQEQLALQSKKKASPKFGGKKNKLSKTAPKPKKQTKPASSSKPKKKLRAITFDEKRLISETIGNLDESQMAKAVQIIRNGVPQLQGLNDDELELDIDTIPNDVLHDLLKYIKQIAPASAAVAAYQDDDAYEPPSRAKNAATQPRKNKPMGKYEQEAAIADIRKQLQGFTNKGSSSDHSPEPVAPHKEESSEEDDSSASESEEE